jgi:DNA-directed RNA polymerase delta subunit
MNSHLRRWKYQFDDVQKVVDALPESHDHTADIQADDKRSRTDTDNVSQLEEEKKDVKAPWPDQESKNIDDHTMIPDRKVTDGSKAGAAKPLTEPQDMITPTP